MEVDGGEPSSLLLDHLLIPVGAKLMIHVKSFGTTVEDHLPRSLDNLRNLSDFIDVRVGEPNQHMRLRGLNGQLQMTTSRNNNICVAVEILARFDTSKTERLEVFNDDCLSRNLPNQTLLAMENLCTLSLRSHWGNPSAFVDALNPNTSLSNVVVCPKLEELILVLHGNAMESHIERVIEMARARASRQNSGLLGSSVDGTNLTRG